jgi:hypothetical protein
MTTAELIKILQSLPDRPVCMNWDGGLRSEVEAVWATRDGQHIRRAKLLANGAAPRGSDHKPVVESHPEIESP